MPIELPYDRREPIERAVVRLYEEYGVRSLPLDPFDLARNMKIDVVAYQNLTNDSSVLKTLEQTSGDGFTLFDPSRMRYRILYNSDYSAASMTRRRFTIAHEIGHIWLEHSDSSRNELEADYFAGYLLAPHPLILRLQLEAWQLQGLFEISYPAAQRAHRQAHQRLAQWLSDPRRTYGHHEHWILDNMTLYAR